MKPISKTHIVLTVVAVIVIAWLVLRHRNDTPVVPTSAEPTAVTEQPLWQSVEVKKENISDSNQYYTIDVSYPVTKDDRITGQFKTFAEGQIAQFKDDTSWVSDPSIDSASSGALSLTIDYKEQKSTLVDAYVFDITTYTGGAHGLQVTRTFSFNKDGRALTLADLFTNGEAGLKTISPFVQSELTKKAISDAKWIAEGAAANAENYQNFVISDAGVTFIFDPYQVAAYAAGTQNILVPTSVFKTIANPDLFTK